MLSSEQRTELDAHGPETVRFKLSGQGIGRGALVRGFKCGDIERGDIEDWLIEKTAEEHRQRSGTLRWAQIAGVAGIVSTILTAVGIVIALWPK